MKISTILDHIDSGHMALPEFQRGYVWNRDQVRGLMDSMYRRHPVGSLLVWATQAGGAPHRGEGPVASGIVKLLLDGQQRMTTLYGIVRGRPPEFFDGNAETFTGLRFNLEKEEFAFYSPVKMKDDPIWVDVTDLMRGGTDGLGTHMERLSADPDLAPRLGNYIGRLSRVLGVQDIDLHIEEVTGEDKSIDVVVDIFNRVNSGGTKLSKGDLAMAKICADWPAARDGMRATLARWREADFHFNMDWLLRCTNTVVTGEAKFEHLHDVAADRIEDGLRRAVRAIDYLLNIISGRLGLDHDRVLFNKYAMPVMVHYLDQRGGKVDDAVERDKLLFWFLQSGMWGRFSGSTESVIDQDLNRLESLENGLDRLIEQLALWNGSLRVQPGHFSGWSLGARFYPVLYLLTRVGEAMDWGTGIPLKSGMLGKMSRLEVHHVFPKAQLYKRNYGRAEVNAVANYCFLTKETNLAISDRPPSEYFPEVEAKHPGALASQWIPMDQELWRLENYRDFLEARKELLAAEANRFLATLLHGELPEDAMGVQPADATQPTLVGGVDSEEEEAALVALNDWVVAQGLPEGANLHELADPKTSKPIAILDLAWPEGLQEGYSQPVAVLLNEGPETLAAANAQGFRCFTSVEAFRQYVTEEILAEPLEMEAAR